MRTAHTPGVVDTKMRVQGIKGLRVADTSVMPFPLAGHTQALAYAIGEKVSDGLCNRLNDLITCFPVFLGCAVCERSVCIERSAETCKELCTKI